MKLRYLLVAFLLMFCSKIGIAQTLHPAFLAVLPSPISESSGVEMRNANSIWTHNDSGDEPRLFNIDTAGNLLRTIYLAIDTAIDWEDITQDSAGNFYIGDFGNNLNNRTDLRIYKIPNPDLILSDTVVPLLITFNFPDQLLFPPPLTEQNFDCEALFHFHDSLYLFSKNRGTSTFCKMYRLPDQAGDYTAELIDSLNTGNWVTAADISPSGKLVILLSESVIWLFSGFTGSDFFGGMAQHLTMSTSQKEGVVFVNDSLVYLTDEKLMNFFGNLYALNLGPWINDVDEIPVVCHDVYVYPNPAGNRLNVIGIQEHQKYEIVIRNLFGELMLQTTNQSHIDVSCFPAGIYLLEAAWPNRTSVTRFVKQ